MKKLVTLFLCLALFLGISIKCFAGGLAETHEITTDINQIGSEVATISTSNELEVGEIYNIRSMNSLNSSPYMLNVWGGIDSDGTRIDMWQKDSSVEQKFQLIESGNYYKLRAMCTSDKVLDAYRPIQSGCTVDIWSNNDDAAQQLIISGSNSSGYVISLASDSSLALTAISNTNDGAVKFNTYTGASNQKWVFTIAEDSSEFYGNLGWTYPFYNNTPVRISAGYKGYSGHHGMDLPASAGTLVRSAAAGTVFKSFWIFDNEANDNTDLNGCGYAIAVETDCVDPETGNNLIYMYHHLQEAPKLANGTILKAGASVAKGIQIGKVGTTGNSTGNHLHMQVTRNGHWHHYNNYDNSINPIYFYPNISFTGDTSIHSNNLSVATLSETYNEEYINKYIVDVSIIEYIGEDKFMSWVNEQKKNAKELTVQNLLTDFSINKLEFTEITKDSGFENIYNFDYITSNYEHK